MKIFVLAVVACALALSGCTASLGDIDAAIQKTAPQACSAISIANAAFVATGLGSDRDKATVAAAFDATGPICADPSHATATQLAVLAVQLGVIAKTMRKVKANG